MEAEKTVHDGFVQAYYKWKEQADRDPEWAASHPLDFEVEKKDGSLAVREVTK